MAGRSLFDWESSTSESDGRIEGVVVPVAVEEVAVVPVVSLESLRSSWVALSVLRIGAEAFVVVVADGGGGGGCDDEILDFPGVDEEPVGSSAALVACSAAGTTCRSPAMPDNEEAEGTEEDDGGATECRLRADRSSSIPCTTREPTEVELVTVDEVESA